MRLHPCGCVSGGGGVQGRSGTGKTSVQCYRLASDWADYWRVAAADGEPRLYILADRATRTAAADESTAAPPAPAPAHLRQLFVTKSKCLRTEVQRVSRDLMRGSGLAAAAAPALGLDGFDAAHGVDGLEALAAVGGGGGGDGQGFEAVPPGRFPVFSTLSEFLLLLDLLLPGGPFVADAQRGRAGGAGELSGLEAYFEGDLAGGGADGDGVDDWQLGDDDAGGDGGGGSGGSRGPGRGNGAAAEAEAAPSAAQEEMTWVTFLTKVWRRLPKRNAGMDASLLWTEINSALKGSVEALKVRWHVGVAVLAFI